MIKRENVFETLAPSKTSTNMPPLLHLLLPPGTGLTGMQWDQDSGIFKSPQATRTRSQVCGMHVRKDEAASDIRKLALLCLLDSAGFKDQHPQSPTLCSSSSRPRESPPPPSPTGTADVSAQSRSKLGETGLGRASELGTWAVWPFIGCSASLCLEQPLVRGPGPEPDSPVQS